MPNFAPSNFDLKQEQETRQCKQCKSTFILSSRYFYRDYTNAQGFKLRCKTCQKQFNAKKDPAFKAKSVVMW